MNLKFGVTYHLTTLDFPPPKDCKLSLPIDEMKVRRSTLYELNILVLQHDPEIPQLRAFLLSHIPSVPKHLSHLGSGFSGAAG